MKIYNSKQLNSRKSSTLLGSSNRGAVAVSSLPLTDNEEQCNTDKPQDGEVNDISDAV